MREFAEETDSTIRVLQIIDVMSRRAGDFGQPHASCHLLFLCSGDRIGSTMSDEVCDIGFFDAFDNLEWHRDHRLMAESARRFWSMAKTHR